MRLKKSPLDLVSRTDEKVTMRQRGQKSAGSKDSSQSHPLKFEQEDFCF